MESTRTAKVTPTPIEPLEIRCPHCDGRGGWVEVWEWSDCSGCGGAGYIPTPAGERLMAFLRHQMIPLMKGHEEAKRSRQS